MKENVRVGFDKDQKKKVTARRIVLLLLLSLFARLFPPNGERSIFRRTTELHVTLKSTVL
jgi:hypothetical protein